jgi:SAM-dependent methyltransferase
MKESLLSLLVCPSCHSPLAPRAGAKDLVEGELVCSGCRSGYPVRHGIPRFVGNGAYADSFGRQWSWFQNTQIDSRNGTRQSEEQLAATTGWGDEDYRGRLVLDAGVGAGRFAEVAARKGAEVVGVDLTRAVDAAADNLAGYCGVHLVQADIFALPFRPETFDLAFSVGTLHHTPDPATAFRRLARTVKPDGDLAVYLHEHRAPLLDKLLRLIRPIALMPGWRDRWLHTFGWYTPEYQWKLPFPEVMSWFRECGFNDLSVFDEPIRVRGRRAAPAQGALHVAG